MAGQESPSDPSKPPQKQKRYEEDNVRAGFSVARASMCNCVCGGLGFAPLRRSKESHKRYYFSAKLYIKYNAAGHIMKMMIRMAV